MWGYDGFGMGWGGMGIGMLLFWGLIIFGIVMLARGFGGRPAGNEPSLREKTPLDILGERYARGEIDKSEFEQLMEDPPVSRIMTREPFTVNATTPLVEAVTILIEKKFGCLPVVDGKELIGIFTEIDALKILLDTLNKK